MYINTIDEAQLQVLLAQALRSLLHLNGWDKARVGVRRADGQVLALSDYLSLIFRGADSSPGEHSREFKNTLETPSGEPELGSGNFTVKK